MTSPASHQFHSTSLREYDIRGIIGETLGEDDAYAIGRSFGTLLARAAGKCVSVGYDGRLSSPVLEAALVKGLNDSGVDALRIGMGPTPMLYYAESALDDVAAGDLRVVVVIAIQIIVIQIVVIQIIAIQIVVIQIIAIQIVLVLVIEVGRARAAGAP